MTMFQPEQFIAEYQQLEHGAARLRVMKKAIAAADEAKATEWQFVFRSRYLNESIFESDALDALIIFPEMLAIYDGNPDLAEEHQHTLMWDFKNMLGNLAEFPQIPLAEIEKLYDEFEARCKRYGYSLHAPRYLREKLSLRTGKLLPLTEYGSFAAMPNDDLQDCPACEADFKVICALLRGDRAEAERLSEPMFQGQLTCAEIPQSTYHTWIVYLQKHGEYGKARQYARRLYPMIRGTMDLLDELGTLMCFYAQVDRQIGCNILRHSLQNYLDCRNRWMQFQFANGAYHLFDAMQQEHLMLVLPPQFPLFDAEHHYETAALRDFFYGEAKTIAEQFDARNGNHYYMEMLQAQLPAYDETAVDFVHGDVERSPSVLGAVCMHLPESLTIERVTALLEADGVFHVALSACNEERGMLMFQVTQEDALYQFALGVGDVPDLSDLRPITPVSEECVAAAGNAEGMIVCIMPFEENAPDVALHIQMQLLHRICPELMLVADLTRMKLLPGAWFNMAAESQVPPLVDYLYGLRLFGGDDDYVWITTNGMETCGMRELEILGATRENFARYCDLLCFATERFLIRGELPDAGTPFTVLRRQDGTPLVCAWLPFAQAAAYYPEGDAGSVPLRTEILGDEVRDLDGNAILMLFDGENADGSVRLKRLDTLTEDDFSQFCYGQYIATGRKIAALAKERYAIFRACFAKNPEHAYVNVCVPNANDEEDDDIWMKVLRADETQIIGLLEEDCSAGKAGKKYTAEVEQLLDFTISYGDFDLRPNTAYLWEQ